MKLGEPNARQCKTLETAEALGVFFGRELLSSARPDS
jgi:hypothetical protein